MRRFTRLTNAFSKKVENHARRLRCIPMYYNFVRLHQTLKMSPAMVAGVTDRLWEMTDLVEMIEAWEAKEKRDARPIFEIEERKSAAVTSSASRSPTASRSKCSASRPRTRAALGLGRVGGLAPCSAQQGRHLGGYFSCFSLLTNDLLCHTSTSCPSNVFAGDL